MALNKMDFTKAGSKLSGSISNPFSSEDIKFIVKNADVFLFLGKEICQMVVVLVNKGKYEAAVRLMIEAYDADAVVKSMEKNAQEIAEIIDKRDRSVQVLEVLGRGLLQLLVQILIMCLR